MDNVLPKLQHAPGGAYVIARTTNMFLAQPYLTGKRGQNMRHGNAKGGAPMVSQSEMT